VWQESREIVKRVYLMTARFPKHEVFGLANQMQRAAVSVMSNIAEGFERGANTEFVQFIYTARASCAELRSDCYVVLDLRYVEESEIQEALQQCDRLSRRLKALADYLKQSGMKGLKFHDEHATYVSEVP
jgi:four helix bundle protein